ncbi:MAG: DpnI domain-containing protein [Pseudomonadota bacterium]
MIDYEFSDVGQASFRGPTQIARVQTEAWVVRELFCPACGQTALRQLPNNAPVADFDCESCAEQFELKSAKTPFGRKVVDGAYGTMMARLEAETAPNLMLLRYEAGGVRDVDVVPRQFFRPSIIERRRPLGPNARRAGWVGCNILLDRIPAIGRVGIVRDRTARSVETVMQDWERTSALRRKPLSTRGWLLDVLMLVDGLGQDDFSLVDLYGFEDDLAVLYPGNSNIRPKIRQQLQVLRDTEFIAFLGRGRYRRLYPLGLE